MRHPQIQLRASPWPAERLAHPDKLIRRPPYQLTDGGALVPTGGIELAPLATSELYLRPLADLDTDDPGAILGFVGKHGPLSIGAALRRYPGLSEHPLLAGTILPKLRRSRKRLAAEVARVYPTPGLDPAAWEEWESLDEFRFGVAWLRDLTSAWRVLRESRAPSAFDWELADWGLPGPESSDGAAELLERRLTPGLAPFHPRIYLMRVEGSGKQARSRPVVDPSSPPAAGSSALPLFSVCCLELFNHIAEGATYRVCANAKCQQPFVRQEGRASLGQHRTEGLKYHSAACAKAQGQRDRRARERAAREDSVPSRPRGVE